MLQRILDWFFAPTLPRLDERDLHETLSWVGRSEVREVHPNLSWVI